MHVIQRGARRINIFRERADYECFLACLRAAAKQHGVAVHGYGLMTNHVHVMVTPSEPTSLPLAIQQVGRWYVPYFNARYRGTGALFQGRYQSIPVPTERWMTCLRYVEGNPVEAGIVDDPEAYPWSSYRAHAFGEWPDWLTPHAVYLGLADRPRERQELYRRLCSTCLTSSELEQLRYALHYRWPNVSRALKKA